jgi:hypothetical protein
MALPTYSENFFGIVVAEALAAGNSCMKRNTLGRFENASM